MYFSTNKKKSDLNDMVEMCKAAAIRSSRMVVHKKTLLQA